MEIFKKYTNPQNYFFWISLALIIKGLSLGFFIWESHTLTPESIVGNIVIKQSDYYMYMGPVENYFNSGTMTLQDNKPFAGRMPGYSFPYLLLRLILSQQNALIVLILLQIFLSAISVYILARIALLLLKHEKYFFITFCLFAISTYTSIFDIFTLPESFSVSALIFSICFLFRYFISNKKINLLFSGFFLAWVIFLRPFLGLLIVVIPIIIFIKYFHEQNLKKAFITGFVFVLPFCIFETSWVTRNYISLHQFVPLEASLNESYGKYGSYRTSAIAIRQLITTWGGASAEFHDNSEAWWFHKAEGKQIEEYAFSPSVFRGNFNKDSLIHLKKIFNESISVKLSDEEKDSLNILAEQTANRYRESYQSKNMFKVYAINPFIRIQKLVFSNPNLLLPLPKFIQMNSMQKLIKLFYIGLYFIVLLGGIAGFIFMIIKQEFNSIWGILILIPIIIIITIIFNPLAIIENKYFLCAYPALILFAMYFLSHILKMKLKNEKV